MVSCRGIAEDPQILVNIEASGAGDYAQGAIESLAKILSFRH
jgi:hypothetical protein